MQTSGERQTSPCAPAQITNDEAVEIEQALGRASGGEVTKERDELIGPSLGEELRDKALIALGVALAAQMPTSRSGSGGRSRAAAVLVDVRTTSLIVVGVVRLAGASRSTGCSSPRC